MLLLWEASQRVSYTAEEKLDQHILVEMFKLLYQLGLREYHR